MHLVSYDLENDRLRLRLSQLLLKLGLYRVQFSVFMGILEPGAVQQLRQTLEKWQQDEPWGPTDSVMLFPLHQHTLERLTVFGAWPERWEEISGDLGTLIL